MWTFDEFKSDPDKQIMTACIVFFLLAFPAYFSFAASGVDGAAGMGGVRDYEVSGELTYVELASGGEYIADGTTLDIENLHTDALDGADDMNIVGVRLTMTYGEDEQAQGGLCQSGTAPDTITGTAMHAGFNESAAGQNSGTGHATTVEWYNSSMIGVISGLSEAEIIAEIDAMGAGLGMYEASIEVSAEGDSCANPLLQGNGDDGEDVSYTIELIVFDYTIAPFIEITDV
ncbi:hypothetical protein OAC38_02650 [Candidatus Poseidoniaceae archaeon]|nr:hypothetical protein [Candidatus Poseidoniaceae archaeon]